MNSQWLFARSKVSSEDGTSIDLIKLALMYPVKFVNS